MRKRILLLFILLSGTTAFAGNDNFPVGARSAGMAHASVTLSDAWSAHHNQAGLALLKSVTGGVYYENKFLLKEMGLNAVSFALPAKSGTFGLVYTSFGFTRYRESKFGLSYGRKLSEKLAIGIGLNYNSIRIGDIYGSKSALTTELGFRYQVNKQLALAAHVYNLNRAKMAAYNNEYIPSQFRLGAQYSFSQKLLLAAEVQQDISHPLIFKSGIEYRALESFALRAGISTSPVFNTFGFGLYLKNFVLDIAASYHQVLGFSPQVGISYAPQKKQKEVPAE